jgi:prolyl oligopeptidase
MQFGKLALAFVLAGAAAGVWHAVGAATVEETGVTTDDPYLWLEDIHGQKPLAWVKEQNARSLAVLKSDPDYQKDYDVILSVLDATDRIPFGELEHDYVFNYWQDAQHPKGLWRRATIAEYTRPNPKWETLIDMDKLAADERENWVWKGSSCAPSLARCLVTLSRGGGDAHVLREFDLTTKRFLPNGFTLPEAKSNFSYVDDDTILFGNDFGPKSLTASGYPRIVKLWHRGTPIADAKAVFEGKAADVAVGPAVLHGPSGAIPLIARSVSFFETEYYYVHKDGSTTKLPLPLSADVKGATRGDLVFTLREDWSAGAEHFSKGSLLAMPVAPWLRTGAMPPIATLYVPGPRSSVEEVSAGRDAVYASIFDNVIGSVHVFRPAEQGKWTDVKLALPGGGASHVVSTNDWGPEAEFAFESYLVPTTLYHDGGNDRPVAIKALPPRFDASNLAMEQFEATSKDGTKIPYFVVGPKNLSAPAPAVLYGYGGFEIALTPGYSANFGKLWLTKGGVFVVANIRGGGEFGPAWHDAALLTNRQKAYDDFQAVAEDLIARGITTRRQLGIMGGSNGGLLVSATMVERPDLFGAVVCQVPLTDMLRYTKIGAGASWAAEYGDPADPAMRAAILKYSPYQNVRADVKYPPVLFVTATSDDRVTPVHARKMAARMEAQGHEVMFYENTDGGHAAAANHKQAAEMWALSFVYLKQKLGLADGRSRQSAASH